MLLTKLDNVGRSDHDHDKAKVHPRIGEKGAPDYLVGRPMGFSKEKMAFNQTFNWL